MMGRHLLEIERNPLDVAGESRATSGSARRSILHLLPQFPYYGGRQVVGSYAAAVLCLSAAQVELGHSVEIASPTVLEAPQRTYAGVPVTRLGSIGSRRRLVARGLYFLRALRHVLRHRGSTDVVHLHAGYPEYLLLAGLIELFAKCRVVQTVYCPPSPRGPRRRLQGFILSLAGRRVVVTAVSEHVATELGQLTGSGARRAPVELTRPAIDRQWWCDEGSVGGDGCQDEETDRPTIVFVGNTTRTKNLEGLIRALGLVKSEGLRFRLLVTTELKQSSPPDAVRQILELARDLDVAGDMESEGIVGDMRALLRRSHIHVAPFRSTQGPSDYFMSTLEAMAVGRAVIASGLSGMREVIRDGEDGLLVDPDDHGMLGSTLARLLADSTLRARLGGSASGRVADLFDPSSRAQELEGIYAGSA